MTVAFRVPEELSARVPAELRAPGRDRDAVRLLVSRGAEVSTTRSRSCRCCCARATCWW